MNIGIIGCGLIGTKRALNCASARVVGVTDTQPAAAAALAGRLPDCRVAGTAAELLARPEIDAVVIAVTHDMLAPLTLAALDAGKHVLVEKPGGRSAEEIEPVIRKAAARRRIVKVGFNHRFHPALLKAREIVDSGALGPLMFIRGRYGHGGRPGYDREWRANPVISGGGEGIDQGVHLVDLSRWFLGDFTSVQGCAPTFFWDMPVEDNIFMILRTAEGRTAHLHATWTEWKNTFCFELSGRVGKIQVDGLGGSYGVERLSYYKMLPQMGPPETTIWEYPGPDTSWDREFRNFEDAIAGKATVCGSLEDAWAALKIVQQVPRDR